MVGSGARDTASRGVSAPDVLAASVTFSPNVELWATFGNTPLTDDDQLGEELPPFALALGECWQGILSARYPDREITVEVSDEKDGSYGPTMTFWTSPAIPDFG